MPYSQRPNKNNDPEVDSWIEKFLSKEPKPGDSITDISNPEDLSNSDREPMLATKRRKITKGLVYRILYPEGSSELVLLVPPNISIAIARKGLSDLKTLSILLHEDMPQSLTLSAKIYLEYKTLMDEHNWSIEDVRQQVCYDLLITRLILQKEEPGTPIYQYAEMFQEALIEFVRVPESKFQTFKENLNGQFVPFTPILGYKYDASKTRKNISDSLKAWDKDFESIIHNEDEFHGALAGFWAISFLSDYWTELDKLSEMSSYNRKNRDDLISKYMKSVATNLSTFIDSGPISEKKLKEFIKAIS